MNSELNNDKGGFFARIIRDALCSLPEANGERQPLVLEQQVQAVVEYSEADTPVVAQSSSTAKSSADTFTTEQQRILLRSTSPQSPIKRNMVNAEAKPSSFIDQHSAVSETLTERAVNKTAANFPRNHRAMAQQQAVKKIPLAISMRDAHTRKGHQPAPIVQRETSARAPVETAIATAPADETSLEAIINKPELTRVETARADSNRPRLQDAPPVVAESAPLLPAHIPERLLPARKTLQPALRIGVVTIRVVDATSEPAESNCASKPVTQSIAIDPIASAESRHFLRTL